MDFIKMIMELPGEKRSQDVVEHTEWNNLWRLIVTQGNHSENYLEQLYDYLFNKEGWVHKVQAELDGVQPYLEGVMTQPVGKAPDGSLWTYPSTESGTVPWGNVMGDITKQQDLIQKFETKADAEHRHDINTLTFNEGDIDSSWISYSSQSVPASALTDLSVTTEKLNNGAVITAKIASGAVINDSIANGAVSGVKIASSTITRAKLAQDALYSPIMVCSGSSYDLSQNECGKTLINDPTNSGSSILEYNIGKGNSQWISAGSEFAFISAFGQVNLCFWDNILIAIAGESSLKNAPLKLKISENFGMVALKKLQHDPEGTGDIWLVTGNVEVVS